DCQQELSLVQTVTRGSRAFLSREEAQHFVKECGLLNCEAVLELLICHLRLGMEIMKLGRQLREAVRANDVDAMLKIAKEIIKVIGETGLDEVYRQLLKAAKEFLERRAENFSHEEAVAFAQQIIQLIKQVECVQMRALGAVASLGCTDLLPQEHILLLTRPRLQELSAGSPGPVTNKATKILRHFEASC
uniref:Designed protein EXTD-3 n=1 Tax=synthetic construct TaxID=32630 RepID=UPI001E1E23EE|nr:Chain A, Designed protein EXTD-3 [synthetic construct]